MKKIISLFQRNYEGDRLVRDEVVPGAEWVIEGEGLGTRKWDGTPVMFNGMDWFKRYDVKKGRTVPEGSIPCQDPDPITGHWPHWVPVSGSEDRWIVEAINNLTTGEEIAGMTYEACGPKINGNAEGFAAHVLIPHGATIKDDCPRDFDGIKEYFAITPIEGIVWHHRDGRMVKIKRKDFGLSWPCPSHVPDAEESEKG